MSKLVLTDCRLFTGGADLTGNSNKIEIGMSAEVKDSTNYGSAGWTEVLAGLKKADLMGAGQWEAGDAGKVDNVSFADLGGVGAWTMCPDGSDVDDVAYLTRALRADYKLGADVGDVAPWNASAQSCWPLSRGRILHPPGTARTSTGTGTAVEYVAATSGQYVYANLHVLSVSGTTPSLTVAIESDAGGAFGSAATVQTFAAATAVGGQAIRIGGPITDTFYRVSYTISGTTPSFLFVVSLGVA